MHRVKCDGILELEKHAATHYNGVLVGSDQIWLPDAALGNFTALRFAPDDMNKISYATSLGVSKYPYYCKSSAANFLKRINHTSFMCFTGRWWEAKTPEIPESIIFWTLGDCRTAWY